jgi:hypothetical protein
VELVTSILMLIARMRDLNTELVAQLAQQRRARPCPNDDTIVSASPPPQIVERGKLADTLIVEAVCDKYIEHQPSRVSAPGSRAPVSTWLRRHSAEASPRRSTCTRRSPDSRPARQGAPWTASAEGASAR